ISRWGYSSWPSRSCSGDEGFWRWFFRGPRAFRRRDFVRRSIQLPRESGKWGRGPESGFCGIRRTRQGIASAMRDGTGPDSVGPAPAASGAFFDLRRRQVIGPFYLAVVEPHALDDIKLHDLEVGRKVEVSWRDERRGNLTPDPPRSHRAPPRNDPRSGNRAVGQLLEAGNDRKADAVEAGGNQARADNPGRLSASEPERAAAETARHEADRQEVAGQVNDVLDVVSAADAAQRLVHHLGEVGGGKIVGAAYADIEIAVLAQGRKNHAAFDQCFDQQVARILAELRNELIALLRVPAQRLVADEQRGMGP